MADDPAALTDAQVDRLITTAAAGPGLRASWRQMLAENAALAEALDDPNVTHLFTPMHLCSDICGVEKDEDSYCALPPAAAVHRTSAWVRANRGLGAT